MRCLQFPLIVLVPYSRKGDEDPGHVQHKQYKQGKDEKYVGFDGGRNLLISSSMSKPLGVGWSEDL